MHRPKRAPLAARTATLTNLVSPASGQILRDGDESVQRGAPATDVGLGVIHGHDDGSGTDDPLLLTDL